MSRSRYRRTSAEQATLSAGVGLVFFALVNLWVIGEAFVSCAEWLGGRADCAARTGPSPTGSARSLAQTLIDLIPRRYSRPYVGFWVVYVSCWVVAGEVWRRVRTVVQAPEALHQRAESRFDRIHGDHWEPEEF